MEIYIEPQAPEDLGAKLAKHLSNYLSQPYLVSLGEDKSGKTLLELEKQAEQDKFDSMKQDALVRAALQTFENAEITNVIKQDFTADSGLSQLTEQEDDRDA